MAYMQLNFNNRKKKTKNPPQNMTDSVFYLKNSKLAHREHSLDRRDGLFGCLFGYDHLGSLVEQAVVHFLERVHPHILAFVARTANSFCHFRRNGNELFIRAGTLHLEEDTRFGSDDKAFGGRFNCVLE